LTTANEAIVRRFLALAQSGDRAGASALLHADVRVIEADSLPYGGVHRGPEGFHALVKRVFRNWDDVRVEVDRFISTGDTVIALARFQGRSKNNGEPFSMPMAEVWRVADGLIVEVQPFYFDTKRLVEL
jgi:uncharacterized protein